MGERLAEQIEVTRASLSEKLIVHNLMQLYGHDFSEFDGADVDEYGLYRYDSIDHYWTEENCFPYLVRVGGKFAGLALLQRETKDDGSHNMFMAEFFILKKYRGQGIGQKVAFALFDRHSGEWQVSEIAQNYPAQAFWRKIIARYTGGPFEEEVLDDGCVLQTFLKR